MSDKVRPLTAADRFLAYERDADRAIGRKDDKPRRRTHRRVGAMDVIVIEEAGAPTRVLLAEGPDGAIIETTVAYLRQALAHVEEVISQPPPTRRKRNSP